jgi:integrase
MREVQKPKGKTKEVSTYSSSEIKALLALAESHRLYALFFLACKTGARRGELLALRWSDFDPKEKTISISKSRGMAGGEIIEQSSTKSKSGNRKVQLSLSVVTALQDHAKRQEDEMVKLGSGWIETGYIFVRENGEPLYPTTPSSIFAKFVKVLGLRHQPFHALRHSHVTELLRAKMPVHMVAKRIGDEVATVQKVYAHSNAEDDQLLADTYEQVLANA